MAILNPRFAFLEADFENPNLTKDTPKIEKNTTKFEETQQITSKARIAPLTPTTIYLKSVPLFVYANAVPADIYSASLFLLTMNLK